MLAPVTAPAPSGASTAKTRPSPSASPGGEDRSKYINGHRLAQGLTYGGIGGFVVGASERGARSGSPVRSPGPFKQRL